MLTRRFDPETGEPMYSYALLAALVVLPVPVQDDKPAPAPQSARVGQAAPAFRVNNHLGRIVQVGGKAAHWTVVAFYPKALTGG